MKHLVDYIKEEGAGAATPDSTMGMGNPSAPSGMGMDPTTPGSGDIPRGFAHRQKKKKKCTKKEEC